MQIEQRVWTEPGRWRPEGPGALRESAQLVLVFGGAREMTSGRLLDELQAFYPHAQLFGCSTAGEICGTTVHDDSVVATAVHLDHSRFSGALVPLAEADSSFEAGERGARSVAAEGLKHVFVLSDGLRVNGSDLVKGLRSALPAHVTITGGLAGDGHRFKETFVFLGGEPVKDSIALLGFYGDRLRVGYGCLGGWDPFGPERQITRSRGNVLYELDGASALELYKRYLGEHADGLPATALHFPLNVRTGGGESGVVRTVLSIDEQHQSMTFAGDVPEGSYARLMKANVDRLIDGAVGAARASFGGAEAREPDLAICISCVGRKLILRQRIEEEVEGVREVLGGRAVLTGFYSYGEISPFTPNARCELHNETMAITSFFER